MEDSSKLALAFIVMVMIFGSVAVYATAWESIEKAKIASQCQSNDANKLGSGGEK